MATITRPPAMALDKEKEARYGKLAKKAYREFLADIEDEDELLALDKEEGRVEESYHDIEARYGDDAWRPLINTTYAFGVEDKKERQEKSKEAIHASLREKRLRRLNINREALQQDLLPLDGEIPRAMFRRLVGLLTKKDLDLMEKYHDFIDRRMGKLLSPFIPKKLKITFREYPDAVLRSAGFLYCTDENHGNRYFWVNPDIPRWFRQGTEPELLRQMKPEYLEAVDRAVVLYYEAEQRKNTNQLKYASTLIKSRVYKYYDLLHKNPEWFRILYENVSEEKRIEARMRERENNDLL